MALKRNLEKFRNTSLPLTSRVSYGDVIATHEDGTRSYGSKANRPPVEIKGKTVEQILDSVVTQDGYFSVLEQILALFDAHAKEKPERKSNGMQRLRICSKQKRPMTLSSATQ